MRIALVTTSWPTFDGDPSGHFVEAEARALTHRGEEVVVIAADGAAFGWPGVAARLRENPLRAVGAAAWVARARSEVARGGFGRVVAHWAVPCAWPVATGGSHALEVVSHGGDVRLIARLPGPVRARIVETVATRAESWRFVAAHLVDAIVEGVPRDVARAVLRVARAEPCFIEVEAPTRAAVEAKRVLVGEPFAVCVARLVASKRVDAAIAWAARERVALVVVGDGPERAKLEARARELGARVTFVGKVARGEALAWIAASVEVVNASRVEGASTVEREAGALGVAVRAL